MGRPLPTTASRWHAIARYVEDWILLKKNSAIYPGHIQLENDSALQNKTKINVDVAM